MLRRLNQASNVRAGCNPRGYQSKPISRYPNLIVQERGSDRQCESCNDPCCLSGVENGEKDGPDSGATARSSSAPDSEYSGERTAGGLGIAAWRQISRGWRPFAKQFESRLALRLLEQKIQLSARRVVVQLPIPKRLTTLMNPARNTVEFLGRQALDGGFDLLDSVHISSLTQPGAVPGPGVTYPQGASSRRCSPGRYIRKVPTRGGTGRSSSCSTASYMLAGRQS